MSAGIRERLALAQKGVMSNAFGSVAAGATVVIQIPPLDPLAWVIASRIDFSGITNAGSVTYELTNGQAVEAGYAADGTQDCTIPDQRYVQLTVTNLQATAVYWNIILISLTETDYECEVRGQD